MKLKRVHKFGSVFPNEMNLLTNINIVMVNFCSSICYQKKKKEKKIKVETVKLYNKLLFIYFDRLNIIQTSSAASLQNFERKIKNWSFATVSVSEKYHGNIFIFTRANYHFSPEILSTVETFEQRKSRTRNDIWVNRQTVWLYYISTRREAILWPICQFHEA